MSDVPRTPDCDALAIARSDLRDLQHRLAVVQQQEAFLLRDRREAQEIGSLGHFDDGEAPLGIVVDPGEKL